MIRLLLVLFALSSCLGQLTDMQSVFEWNEIEYEFPSDAVREAARDSGEYVPGNGVPIDVDVQYYRNTSSHIIAAYLFLRFYLC